ncbi:helix-turn-helix DNA binding domain protein [Microbacterium phage Mashley]|nr:helix-turn-helix DNA binding domain protein [Microbacterium phage Mashley]QQO39194.1 helix-turn-helix DNA-binding domain protein [Microbacterium phage Rudy]QWY80501.1 helix-turn-helix DNA binding domain protein [Microbacterium phage Quammi]QXN73939.1 helix-turn-helix DNA binding domain protein [Microbacterium phage Blab]UJD20749.1 helix-turn-helix DNA binding domain protein [Microbacterium phage AluminumJesus]UVG33858.1 helix-turn-helix DNA binding domain protein [Microbacterium phage Vicer
MTLQDDPVLTPEEAAKLLRMAESTLKRWRRETRKEKTQIGPHWVVLSRSRVGYRRSAIDAYLSSREQRADG